MSDISKIQIIDDIYNIEDEELQGAESTLLSSYNVNFDEAAKGDTDGE